MSFHLLVEFYGWFNEKRIYSYPTVVYGLVEINELLRQLQDVQRLIRSKEDDLHLLRLNVEQGIYPTEANLKKIIEIEAFHNKIQRILKSELKEASKQIESEIEPLQAKAETLVKEVDSIHPSQVFTDDFLEAYTMLW